MATEVNLLSDCWLCSHALLCPDGSLRCGPTLSDTEYTFSLAQELCGEFESGGYKVYVPPKQKRILEKPLKVKMVKAVKPKAVRKSGKSKTNSWRLL